MNKLSSACLNSDFLSDAETTTQQALEQSTPYNHFKTMAERGFKTPVLACGSIQGEWKNTDQGIPDPFLETASNDYMGWSSESLEAQRIELWAQIETWHPKRIHTALGAINNLLYHASHCFGCVNRDEQGQLKIDRDALIELCDRPIRLVTAFCHTKDYLSKWWPSAFTTDKAVRGVISSIQKMGLLHYESEWQSGRTSRVYDFLDIPGLLILAEALEKALGFDQLPKHGAALLQKMFNALFSGWGYNRRGDAGQSEPETHEDSVIARAERSMDWHGRLSSAWESAVAQYETLKRFLPEGDAVLKGARQDLEQLAKKINRFGKVDMDSPASAVAERETGLFMGVPVKG